MLRFLLAVVLLMSISSATIAAEKPTPIIIDTDLGSDIDDAFALALAIASPECEVIGITTVSGDTTIRAKMALRFLHAVGRTNVPVAAGATPQPAGEIAGQYQYYYHPAVLYNRAGQPQKASAVEFLATTLKQSSEKITIVALGPLTNVARLLAEHPDAKDKIARIVVMGGSLARNYQGEPQPTSEWNIKCDIPAAKAVFAAGVPLTVVPLDVTWDLQLNAKDRAQLFEKKSMLTMQIEALYQMWNQSTPILFDPVAMAAVVKRDACAWEDFHLRVTDEGITQVVADAKANAQVATRCDREAFCSWHVKRVADGGQTSLPKKPGNESKLMEDARFPARVHVVEDFETDIEQRWWLAGRIETKDVPPDSKRAFRSQLTLDFDDLQGQLDTMYNAVVFNPVPGPAMGPATRLKFRYQLKGTDTLRVQIYSLSNGYHRYLSLTGLPQEKWEEATIDMTAARRPDGSGGALAQDERIDDIQFYVDPRAEILIDDICLYDAGAEAERRPFPQRIVFAGGFDTGKQGQEWPGTFEIVHHAKDRPARYARSVTIDGKPKMIVHLRGKRTLTGETRLDLRYRVAGKAEPIEVSLRDGNKASSLLAKLSPDVVDEWRRATLLFPQHSQPISIDQIDFKIPQGSALEIDDLLLYEP